MYGTMVEMNFMMLLGPVETLPIPILFETITWDSFNIMSQYLYPSNLIPPYAGILGWMWVHMGHGENIKWVLLKVL